jgi:hypothetical protein
MAALAASWLKTSAHAEFHWLHRSSKPVDAGGAAIQLAVAFSHACVN